MLSPSAVKEKITKDIPSDVVMELAHQKALDVYKSRIKDNPAYQTEDCIVIGADTIVSYRGEILGKPADNEEAFDMLSMHRGPHTSSLYRSHIRRTYQREADTYIHFYEKRMLHFIQSQKRIFILDVDSGDSLDKAGAYGIQGAFAIHVKGIEGDYNNVVGLPIARLYHELDSILPKEKIHYAFLAGINRNTKNPHSVSPSQEVRFS